MNRWKAIFPVTAFFVFFHVLAQAPNPGTSQNAAVKYLRADVSLRQSYPLPADAWVKLEEALDRPIQAEDEKLVAAAAEALTEFQHGANILECNWEMSVEDGPFANTSHRGAIRELAAMAGLRARIRFRDGDRKGAIADILAGDSAARHLSLDGSIASVLFGYKVEREVSGILQDSMSLLAPEELAELESGLGRLPPGSSMQRALEQEKINRKDLLPIVENAKNYDDLVSRMSAGIPALKNDPEQVKELVNGCGGTVAGVIRCIAEQDRFYKKWIASFGLAPEQFQRQYDIDFARASAGNSVLARFTPSLPRFRWAEAYNETRRALLRAAVAVEQDGPKAASRYPDPSNGEPFSYTRLVNGFRLESLLKENGKLLSISILRASK